MAEGIDAESEPRKDVAHDRDQRESMAGEAGSDEQAADTGNGTALERERPFGRVASHYPDARPAGAGRRVAEPEAREHRDARTRVGAAQMIRRVEPTQTSADDDDPSRHD